MNVASADALIAKGFAFEKAGQLTDSIQCYLEATQVRPTAQAYLRLVDVQMRSQLYDQAYKSCKTALALYPQEAGFHQVFARLKETRGDLDTAREVLRLAAEKFPDNTDVAVEYAAAQIRAKQFTEAIPTLEHIVALEPSAEIYRALSKMRRNIGDKAGSQRVIREALKRFPLDVPLARDCALFDRPAAAEAQSVMRSAAATMDGDPAARSGILRYLAEMQAGANRRAAHLSPAEATDWIDLVRWSDPEGMAALVASLEDELAGPAPRVGAVSERASAAVAQMDWTGAEQWFARARKQPTHSVADVTTFDPEFYRTFEKMADEDVWSLFPPTSEVLTRRTWPATIIYIACDPKYFELFMPRFLSSFTETGADAGVHVHLLDGAEEDWKRLAKSLQSYGRISVSMTAENGARRNFGFAARNYYHAARYVRFHQYLAQNLRPAWIMDVDLVVESDPAPMFKLLEGYDFAATTSAVSLEPWAKFRAGLVGIAPTPAGLRYLRLVAAYISHWFRRDSLQWGIDQQALFGAYFHLEHQGHAPKARFLGEEFMNDRDGLPCIIRPVTDADSRWEKAR